MRPPTYQEAIAEQHRHDLLREAEQIRQAKDLATPPLLRRLYGPLLARLGHWMLIWGTRLTTTYARQAAQPESQSY